MHQLYVLCGGKNDYKPVNEDTHCFIFCQKFNLNVSKKDVFDHCETFNTLTDQNNEILIKEQNHHVNEKDLAREHMKRI